MKRSRFLAYALTGILACSGGLAVWAQRGRPAQNMQTAAKAFLESLDAAQKQKAAFAFDSDERTNYHFTPVKRLGLPLKEMTEPQRKAAFTLLSASLSEKGVQRAASVRDLEKILLSLEMGKGPVRDPELYFFSVFGEPSDTGSWGWRYEGHHCALNWTVVKGRTIVAAPQFYGTNPAEVRVDVPGAPARGTRVLAAEEDLARALLGALTDEQKKTAIIDVKAPADIISGEKRQVAILEDKGLAYSDMNADQKKMLEAIIQEYASKQLNAVARQRVQKLRQGGLDAVKFAWMGSTEKGQGHYYRVQGASFLIEYDNTQGNANHVHSVWREFNGDFGRDLLAEHYRATPHRYVAAR